MKQLNEKTFKQEEQWRQAGRQESNGKQFHMSEWATQKKNQENKSKNCQKFIVIDGTKWEREKEEKVDILLTIWFLQGFQLEREWRYW